VSEIPAPPNSYAYDFIGRRISKKIGDITTTYVYIGLDEVADWIRDNIAENGKGC
jgi:hypothetical protein